MNSMWVLLTDFDTKQESLIMFGPGGVVKALADDLEEGDPSVTLLFGETGDELGAVDETPAQIMDAIQSVRMPRQE